MAYFLPNLSPTLLQSSKEKPSPIDFPKSPFFNITSASSSSSSQVKLDSPPPRGLAQVNRTPEVQDSKQGDERNDFYVNLGSAVRTLREDLPLIFTKDLNYTIYRDDVTFKDPLNTFIGIEKYKLIFWALRFHGRVLFREISLEIQKIWQPSENVILIRWNLRGIPRVPWEAKGQFQGTSRYKLDRNGKIYEHNLDNLAFNLPTQLKPAASVMELVAACPAPPSPNPTFLWGPVEASSSPWIEYYRAVIQTLDCGGSTTVSRDFLATCCSS